MRLASRLPLLVVAWFFAEVVAFGLIARAVGFGGALFLCLLTSLAGVAMLRRIGVSTAWRLQRALATRSPAETGLSRDAMIDGGLAAIGSILLIMPGFVSDFCGLALAAPSVRGWLGDKIRKSPLNRGAEGRGSGPAVIELDPQEWTRTEMPGGKAAQTSLSPQNLSS
jgi:UPF0716 protein FxsA